MELVAAARLRRAEERITQMRDYADRMQELTAGTARAASSLRGLTLLQQREPNTVAIVALTGDRGLAGAFNGQILRRAFALERSLRMEGREVRWLVVGRKGRSTLEFRRYRLEQAWMGFTDRPSYHDAHAGAHKLARLRARRPHDRDAQRVEERRRADRQPHARPEPRTSGRNHAGNPGSRRRR